MFFENKIYRNDKLINIVTTSKQKEIIKELVNCFYFRRLKAKKLILNNREYLMFKYYFTHKQADGETCQYLYNITFSFDGIEGINL